MSIVRRCESIVRKLKSAPMEHDSGTSPASTGNPHEKSAIQRPEPPVQIESETSVSSQSSSVPGIDGGRQAWTVVVGSSCIFWATYGLLTSNGLFYNYWSSNQLSEYPSTEVAWIPALHVFLTLFLGGQTGILYDRYGPRVLLAVGGILYVGGLFTMAECSKYWHFILSYGVLAGTGCALLSSVALSVIVQWFDRKRGLATGIVFMASSMGGIMFPLIMRVLFKEKGWAFGMRIVAGIVSILVLIGNVCIKGRKQDRTKVFVNPKEYVDPRFIYITAGLGFFEFVLFGSQGLLPDFAEYLNYDSSTRFNMIAVMNASSGLGRIVCGLLSDRIGCYNVIILSALWSIIAIFAFWLPSGYSVILIYIFAAAFGFSSGSMISIGPSCVAKLCKVEQYGQYYGTSYSITSFVNLICVPIGSKLLIVLGAEGFAAFFGALLVMSAIFLSLARWAVLSYSWNWMAKV